MYYRYSTPPVLLAVLWLSTTTTMIPFVHSEEDLVSEFRCNICGSGFQVGNIDGLVAPEGRDNRTCGELQSYGDDGLISEDQCQELIPYVQQDSTCGCEPFICTICGVDGYSSNPGGIIDVPGDSEGLTTCFAVETAANAGGFNETVCQTIQLLAMEPCGCMFNISTEEDGPTRAPTPTSTLVPSPPTVRNPLTTAPTSSGGVRVTVSTTTAITVITLVLATTTTTLVSMMVGTS